MKTNPYFSSLLIILLTAFTMSVQAQKKYDLFYVNIGSAHYDELLYLEAANTAATQMATLFNRMGATDGVTVLSTNTNQIDSTKIFNAVEEIIYKAKKAKAKNPLIIFYYAGHGFTSGIDKSHFIPPGSLDTLAMKNATQEDWINKTIAPLQIKEMIEESKMDFMMMIDCCYKGDEKKHEFAEDYIIKYFGLEEMDDLMRQTFKIFAAMNIMVGPDPVIFSCPPGQTVSTEPYNFGEGKQDTAPLCRRAYIILDHKFKNISVSVSDFLVMMLSSDIDPVTNAAFSDWKLDQKNFNYLRLND